jgi:hypothetical protein
MQLKPITVVAVLLLVVGSLSVAGCTTDVPVEVKVGPANQATNQAGYVSTTYPASGRSQLVQGCVEYYRHIEYIGGHYDPYNVTWINNTAANTVGTVKNGEGYMKSVRTVNMTFIHFPTVAAASAYFDSLRPLYLEKSTYISGVPYDKITGTLPTVTKEVKNTNNHNTNTLTQQDALITKTVDTTVYVNPAPSNQA